MNTTGSMAKAWFSIEWNASNQAEFQLSTFGHLWFTAWMQGLECYACLYMTDSHWDISYNRSHYALPLHCGSLGSSVEHPLYEWGSWGFSAPRVLYTLGSHTDNRTTAWRIMSDELGIGNDWWFMEACDKARMMTTTEDLHFACYALPFAP